MELHAPRIVLVALGLMVPSLAPAAAPSTQPASTQPATQPGNAHERLVLDMIAFSDQLTEILRGVTDEATAKAAVPRLEAAREQLLLLRERTLELGTGEPSKQVRDALEKHREAFESAWKGTAAEQQRVRSDPALEALLGKHLDALQVFQAAKVEQDEQQK